MRSEGSRNAEFDVFDEVHPKIRNQPASALITVLLVEAHGAVQGRRGIQRNARTTFAKQNFFDLLEKQKGDAASLPLGMYAHPAKVTFSWGDEAAANRSGDVAMSVDGDKE